MLSQSHNIELEFQSNIQTGAKVLFENNGLFYYYFFLF